MRPFPREIYRGLKTATGRMFSSFGCLAAAAASLGVSEQLLSGYQNNSVDHEKRFIRLDLMIDAIKETQDFSMLDYIASIFGKKLVDDVEGLSSGCAMKTVICSMGKMSATELQMALSIEDGEIDEQEAAKIIELATEAQKGLANVIASLESADVAGGA